MRRTVSNQWGVVLAGIAAAATAWGGSLPRLSVRDGALVDSTGHAVRLFGVNLFQSHLLWSRRQDLTQVEPELVAIAANGFNAVRMPLNMAWFEPRPGVFPDSPDYAEVMASHRLPAGAMAFYDGLIRRAGELGLYVIPEFHELPSDPYRWFVGGEERDRRTGKPGTAIAWMGRRDEEKERHVPDPDLARAEVPKALGWLAAHWRGVDAIAGIEVPWNEPRGVLTEPAPFHDLVQACARAVKQADPDRLVFMDCVDWGAMVNHMPDESLWKVPAEVDGLFPHFYPGMHSGNSGEVGTWSTTMANWISWFGGSGKVVMVGEYGVVEMKRARYWQGEISDTQRARTYAACVAQWYAMGVQGLFCWAWQGGIGRDGETGALNAGAEELPKWAAPFRESELSLASAPIGVVCHPGRRSKYGDRKDLWRVSDALLDAGLTPFCTVFSPQVAAQPDVLRRFRVLLVLPTDVPDTVEAAIRESSLPVVRLDERLESLDAAVGRVAGHVTGTGVPGTLVVGRARGQVTVFDRSGEGYDGKLRVLIPGAAGPGRVENCAGELVWEGDAGGLSSSGFPLKLAAWECAVLRWAQR